MRAMRWISVLVVVLVAAAGCGTPVGGPGEANGPALGEDPSEWVLVDGVPLVEGYPVTLQVADGEVGGTAACNSYGGQVEVTGDRFVVGDLMHTEMGCPEPGVHDSESAYLEALRAVERHERSGAQLVLTGEGVELRFDPVAPEPAAELAGTDWRLESLIHGAGPDGAVSSTMAAASLRLDDDGTLSGSDGCNELFGRWSLAGDVLVVEELGMTDMACPGTEEQTAHVVEVLTGEPTVELDGAGLRLTAGERGLDYRAG